MTESRSKRFDGYKEHIARDLDYPAIVACAVTPANRPEELGAVPIALGYGAGGEARQPLGLVVVGGLLFSQLVTLYLTPVFYTYMAALQDRVQSWKRGKKQVTESPVAG